MGKGFVYRCPKCGHEEKLLSGVGFMSPVEADMERESILAGIYGTKANVAPRNRKPEFPGEPGQVY